jgi:chromosome segregation ATPase
MKEKDFNYVERLEKIIDKQDELLTHLDARFNQQQAVNDELSKRNQILREDIQKHKDLLRDMNKTLTQHKNVINKLRKELEEQLKIQQDLHKDYGEVIKGLTEELEEEKNKNESKSVKKEINKDNKKNSTNSDKVELPPREHDTDYVSSATNMFHGIKDKSSEVITDLSKNDSNTKEAPKGETEVKEIKCPNCGTEVKEGYIFCDSCGTKLS